MNEPRPQKPRKRRVPKFGEKRPRHKSQRTTPDTPKGQLDLDLHTAAHLDAILIELFN